MSDYSKSVIYKYYKEDITEIYIGSTHNEKQREQLHKSVCNNVNSVGYNLKVYQFMRENGGYDNWNYEILENYPCDNKIQLVEREQYYYDLLNPLLNSQRPYVSEEEIKEEKRIYDKKYYQEHIEEKATYRDDHKKDVKEYNAKYHEENRDEILKYNNQKHTCECGGKYTTSCKARHYKTNKHKKYIEKK